MCFKWNKSVVGVQTDIAITYSICGIRDYSHFTIAFNVLHFDIIRKNGKMSLSNKDVQRTRPDGQNSREESGFIRLIFQNEQTEIFLSNESNFCSFVQKFGR